MPQRLIVISHPNGTTSDPGSVEVRPALLERFADLEGQYTLVKNINNTSLKNSQINSGIGTPHSDCYHGFLSGQIHPAIGDEKQGFDQMLAADPRHQGAKFDSLSIICAKRGSGQLGVPQDWYNTFSWKGPMQPVPAHHDPRALFEEMFADFEPESDPFKRAMLERKQLYLDAVLDQIQDLRPRLNTDDAVRLDEYLTGVEELDAKTAALLDGGVSLDCDVGERPDLDLPLEDIMTPPEMLPAVVDAMQDLTVRALQCDVTRIVTFAFSPPANGNVLNMPFVEGIEGSVAGWHPLSHWNTPYGSLSGDVELNRRDYERLLIWVYDRVADFVGKLQQATGAGGRPLLDDTLVAFGSWMGAAVHGPDQLYQFLFGSAGGKFKLGETVHCNPGTSSGSKSIGDLWLSVMHGFGMDVDAVGMGSTGVPELLV